VQRSLWGIVGLRARYPASILEQAAGVALARHLHSYKALRALADQLLTKAVAAIEALHAQPPWSDAASTLTQQHELIRETSEYAEFFNRRVRE
jgi:hypothetical protein